MGATIRKTDWVKVLIPFKNSFLDIKQGDILQVTWIDPTPNTSNYTRAVEVDVKNEFGEWDNAWLALGHIEFYCTWDKHGDNL
jgi:hypothetical protein